LRRSLAVAPPADVEAEVEAEERPRLEGLLEEVDALGFDDDPAEGEEGRGEADAGRGELLPFFWARRSAKAPLEGSSSLKRALRFLRALSSRLKPSEGVEDFLLPFEEEVNFFFGASD
jgi:hypothetical protein